MRTKKRSINILLIVLSALGLVGYINLIPPDFIYAYLIFHFLLLLIFYFFYRLFFGIIRSTFWAIVTDVFLVLRQNHLDGFVNILLLLALLFVLDQYFKRD